MSVAPGSEPWFSPGSHWDVTVRWILKLFAHELDQRSALGGNRTPNLLIRSQMLYPLSYERSRVVRKLQRYRLTGGDRTRRPALEGAPGVAGPALTASDSHA
jgi:hypothetical protein